MSKTPSQEKTQQDLHKYWNSTSSNIGTREKDHPISSNNEFNVTNKEIDQPISSNSDQTTNLNDKKRKVPVKEKIQEETSSPPKRMHETAENKDEFHRSSSSSNLQVTTNPNPNITPNPSWDGRNGKTPRK